MRMTEDERFDSKYRVDESGCWTWTAGGYSVGYGTFYSSAAKRTIPAHRFSYERRCGAVVDSSVPLDHLCRNRRCVNPDHLEPVTHRTNILRGVGPTAVNAAKTHCIHGHEFTPENTRWRGRRRQCRTCHREQKSNHRAVRRGAAA